MVPGREGTVERPSLGCGICPTSCGEPAHRTQRYRSMRSSGRSGGWAPTDFGRISYRAFRCGCETSRGVRRVNAKGRDRAESISECLSHRRGDRTPSIEFAIRQDVDRVRPGFFWPVMPAGLGRRFIRPASTALKVPPAPIRASKQEGVFPPVFPLLEASIEYRGDNANHHPFTPRVLCGVLKS